MPGSSAVCMPVVRCHGERGYLHCKFGADALDGVAHVHVLVDGHDVWGAGGHALQEAPAAADVQDDLQIWVRLQQHRACELTVERLSPLAHGSQAEPSECDGHARQFWGPSPLYSKGVSRPLKKTYCNTLRTSSIICFM